MWHGGIFSLPPPAGGGEGQQSDPVSWCPSPAGRHSEMPVRHGRPLRLRRECPKSAGFPSRPGAPTPSRQSQAHYQALSLGFWIAVCPLRSLHKRGAS
ncbi:hypothetical protein NDU88_006474 [Pleurodeles waltl]|uniref:Uncharacterized protein n=1 Tax=Pleurodeles waltl TaxID=8319 RepID=A0AAV7X2R5_PLEWA|nr:hypothetical protein NDU88_006474 [Pleurodeles waltl]